MMTKERQRKLANKLLFKTPCVIVRQVRIPRPGGGPSQPTPTVVAKTTCAVGPISAATRTIAQQMATEANATVKLPAGTDVRADDVITVEGISYNVLRIVRRDSAHELAKEVLVST